MYTESHRDKEIKALLLEDRVSLADVRAHVEHELASKRLREETLNKRNRASSSHNKKSDLDDLGNSDEDMGAIIARLNVQAKKAKMTNQGGDEESSEQVQKLRAWRPTTLSDPSGDHAVIQADLVRKNLSRNEHMFIEDHAPTSKRKHLLTPREHREPEEVVREQMRNKRQRELESAYFDMNKALLGVIHNNPQLALGESSSSGDHHMKHQQQQQYSPPAAGSGGSVLDMSGTASSQQQQQFSPIRSILTSTVQTPPLPRGWKSLAEKRKNAYDFSDDDDEDNSDDNNEKENEGQDQKKTETVVETTDNKAKEKKSSTTTKKISPISSSASSPQQQQMLQTQQTTATSSIRSLTPQPTTTTKNKKLLQQQQQQINEWEQSKLLQEQLSKEQQEDLQREQQHQMKVLLLQREITTPPPASSMVGGALTVSRKLRQLRNDAAYESALAMGGSTQQKGQLLAKTAHLPAKIRRDMTVGALTVIGNTQTYKTIQQQKREKKRQKEEELRELLEEKRREKKESRSVTAMGRAITVASRRASSCSGMDEAQRQLFLQQQQQQQEQQQESSGFLPKLIQQKDQQISEENVDNNNIIDDDNDVQQQMLSLLQHQQQSNTTTTTNTNQQQVAILPPTNQLVSNNNASSDFLNNINASNNNYNASVSSLTFSASTASPLSNTTGTADLLQSKTTAFFNEQQIVRKEHLPEKFTNDPDAAIPWSQGNCEQFIQHCVTQVAPVYGADEIARVCFNFLEFGQADYINKQKSGGGQSTSSGSPTSSKNKRNKNKNISVVEASKFPWNDDVKIQPLSEVLFAMIHRNDEDEEEEEEEEEIEEEIEYDEEVLDTENNSDSDNGDGDNNKKFVKKKKIIKKKIFKRKKKKSSDSANLHKQSSAGVELGQILSGTFGNMTLSGTFGGLLNNVINSRRQFAPKSKKLGIWSNQLRRILDKACGELETSAEDDHVEEEEMQNAKLAAKLSAKISSSSNVTNVSTPHHHEQQQEHHHDQHDQQHSHSHSHHQQHQHQHHGITLPFENSNGVVLLPKEEKKLLIQDVFSGIVAGGGGSSPTQNYASAGGDDADGGEGGEVEVVTKQQGVASFNAAQKLGVLDPILKKLPPTFLFSKSAEVIIRGFAGVDLIKNLGQQQQQLEKEKQKEKEKQEQEQEKNNKKNDENNDSSTGEKKLDGNFTRYLELTKNTREYKKKMSSEENFARGITLHAQATLDRCKMRNEQARTDSRRKLYEKLDQRRKAAESVLSNKRSEKQATAQVNDITDEAERRAKVWKLLRMPPGTIAPKSKNSSSSTQNETSKDGGKENMWQARLEQIERREKNAQQCRLFCIRACLALFATSWPPTEEAVKLLAIFCDTVLGAQPELSPSQFFRWLHRCKDILARGTTAPLSSFGAGAGDLNRESSCYYFPESESAASAGGAGSPSTTNIDAENENENIHKNNTFSSFRSAVSSSSLGNINQTTSTSISPRNSPSQQNINIKQQQQQIKPLPWDCMFIQMWIRKELGVPSKAHASWCELHRKDGFRYDHRALG